MEFDDFQWLLISLPVAFALGWLASRFDIRQIRRENRDAPRAYFKGLNLLLNEQQDKAIDAFIEAVQNDPDTTDLHFALGNLFRRRGEFERAVRVHQHLLNRADLKSGDRDRAQHALAHDYMKAGLFDRAEQAWHALEGTVFDSEARLALLQLYERSRDWRNAADVAAKLDRAGGGSFSERVAHHWCELALEADARDQPDEAEAALRQARQAAPQAARPLVLAGQRLARAGRHAEALQAWDTLRAVHPASFLLVADAYAASALAAHDAVRAHAALAELYEQLPSMDLLRALSALESSLTATGETPLATPGAASLSRQLQRNPTLSAAQALLDLPPSDWPADGLQGARDAVARAAKPLQRYRCAACGFEAQSYFWQCPGCMSWDSYPPQRIEEF